MRLHTLTAKMVLLAITLLLSICSTRPGQAAPLLFNGGHSTSLARTIRSTAAKTLLLNHGSLISAVGPNPTDYNQGEDPSGKWGTALYPHSVQGSSYGALSFPSMAYNPTRGTIEFFYKPAQTTGNIICCIGGDPNSEASALALYQNWYWGNNYPLVSAQAAAGLGVAPSGWGYTIAADSSPFWTWDSTRWYHIALTYKIQNQPDDFVHLFIDGKLQKAFNGPELRNITSQLSGPLYLAGYSPVSYSNSPARFDDIRIVDDVIYTSDFKPPSSELGVYGADVGKTSLNFAARQRLLSAKMSGDATATCAVRAANPEDRYDQTTILKGWISPEASCTLSMSAAGNESEAAQMIVVPLGRQTQSLTYKLAASKLAGPNGSTIPAANVSLREVGYIPTIPPDPAQPGSHYRGYYADALLPSGPVTIHQDRITPIWVRVTVPRSTPPGAYRGTVKFVRTGRTAAIIHLRVYGFNLPAQKHLRTAFWISRGHIETYFNFKPTTHLTWSQYTPWLDTVLNAGVSPIDYDEAPAEHWFKVYLEADNSITVDISEWQRYAQYICSRGATAINMGPNHFTGCLYDLGVGFFPGCPATRRSDGAAITLTGSKARTAVQLMLSQAKSYLEANGWGSRGYVQVYDEPNAQARPYVNTAIDYMHADVPGIQVLLTTENVGDANNQTKADIWCPRNGSGYNPQLMQQHRAAGGQCWTYECTTASKGIIHNPPFVNRRLWWTLWNSRYDGYLYWGTNNWAGAATAPANRWPLADWTSYTGNSEFMLQGDGNYLYPYKDMTPCPRVDLETSREGTEDYEYFWLLQSLVNNPPTGKSGLVAGARALLSAIPSKTTAADMRAHRNAIGEEIEAFSPIIRG